MDAIHKELGEADGSTASVVEEYRKKIAAAQMPDHVQQQAERELDAWSVWVNRMPNPP
jgi:ATP-dependent Lon protease